MSRAAIEDYQAQLRPVREAGLQSGVVRSLLDPSLPGRLLHRFLIEYCARGVQITQPVAGWIGRAGRRCKELGLVALGDSLTQHAAHEAGHELLFVEDTRRLVQNYNERYGEELSARALLVPHDSAAVARYVELHEQTIAGPAPFAQVAIELEIEALSVALGPLFLSQVERALGSGVLACLSFLREHVALDAGHTALNQRMLQRLLAERPDALAALIGAGTAALSAYLDFIRECFEAAASAADGTPSYPRSRSA